MKGQNEVLVLIMITGILFAVIAAVWLWATPIIERNKEISALISTEDFVKDLANKIKIVAKNGGKAELRASGINTKTTILLNVSDIQIFTVTHDTIYEKNFEIPLKETPCGTTAAIWGLNDSDVICILSVPIGKDNVRTRFSINFIQLNAGTTRAYKITLLPLTQISGLEKASVLLENKGVQETTVGGRTLISTLVAINIV